MDWVTWSFPMVKGQPANMSMDKSEDDQSQSEHNRKATNDNQPSNTQESSAKCATKTRNSE